MLARAALAAWIAGEDMLWRGRSRLGRIRREDKVEERATTKDRKKKDRMTQVLPLAQGRYMRTKSGDYSWWSIAFGLRICHLISTSILHRGTPVPRKDIDYPIEMSCSLPYSKSQLTWRIFDWGLYFLWVFRKIGVLGDRGLNRLILTCDQRAVNGWA